MKNYNLFFTLLTLITIMFASIEISAQSVKGDGNVVQETRSTGSFEKIKIEGTANIFLSQGNIESVIIETDKNLLPYIETVSDGNELAIRNRSDAEIKNSTKMNVYVFLKNVNRITNDGVANVASQTSLYLNDLKISSNGVGNFKLDLNCNKLDADINSVGNLSLTGSVNEVAINNSGVGNVKAFDLTANIVRIMNNGVGNAEVNCVKEIYINLNGLGNITYKGDPVVKEKSVNGFGKVKKL